MTRELKMENEQPLTPVDVCEMFDISKSTLIRWEEDGTITPPDRDLRGQRQYSQRHLEEIGTLLLKKQYQKLAKAGRGPGVVKRMDSLAEHTSLTKFVVFKDVTGLYELTEREDLSNDTIRQLLQEASQRDPSDQAFRWIIKRIICPRIEEPEDS